MKACRACRSDRLTLFLPLGDHPLANGFLDDGQLARPEAVFPLDTYACLDCGLIQISDNVPADYFRQYVYVPSTSDVMHAHFAAFADAIVTGLLPDPGGLVVDIGCNDGLLLKSLKDRGAHTLGVDPATNIVEIARGQGVEVVNEYFDSALARRIRAEYGPARVIVTTNTFHHIGDLDPFTEGVAILLDDGGTFIVELPHALEIVAQNQFDGIYHEHVSQFTVKSIVDHCRLFGMEVYAVEKLPVHGGSIRAFVRKAAGADAAPLATVAEWIARERGQGLFSADTYAAFRDRVETIRNDLMALLGELKDQGHRIVGYGASARGNTLLNYYRIGPDILDYIADRNSLKNGLYTPGMHIPVVPVERIVEDRPDFVLVLAWNFAEEIMAQQDEYRRLGGRFVLPIPEPRIVAEDDGPGGHDGG